MSAKTDPPVVNLSREGLALVITITRPDDQNRINRRTMEAIAGALDEAESDSNVAAVVVTGQGEYFCAGGRIDGYPGGTVEDQLAFARAFVNLQHRMGQCGVPIIGAVTGHCVAGGMSLLEACDLAIASRTSEFAYPEIGAGLFPMLAMAVARHRLPAKVAFDLFYSGRRCTADEAARLFLVNRVEDPDAVWPIVRNYVNDLAGKSRSALAIGRRAYHAMGTMDVRSALEYAQTALITMLASAQQPNSR